MPTDADLAGLAEENVKQFEDMGFDRPKVVSRSGISVCELGG